MVWPYSFLMTFVHAIGDLCARLERGDMPLPPFLLSIVRLTTDHIPCSRAALWVFEESAHGRRLRCIAMHDRGRGESVRVPDEVGGAVTDYFRSLKLSGHIVAEDVQANPITSALFLQRASSVKSLLGVPLSVNGETFGTLACTQLGDIRRWTASELSALRLASAKLSLSVSNVTRHATLTQPAPLSTL
ncbi:MAG: GAF domain-containing protein [Pseudomonadota bacterium]